ncbi:MAG: MarR family transcriptional regulator [Motiliproteus sp.]|nr:MarR family transcriptional regulator [Motiliproteus sp.]
MTDSFSLDAYTLRDTTITMSETNSSTCLNLCLRKASRVITQIYEQQLAEFNLKSSQFSILHALKQSGETTAKTLQNLLVLDQTTLSRGLKPLIRDGYIDVHPGQDRREKLLKLSEKGVELHQKAEKKWHQTQDQVRNKLGEETTIQLVELTKKITSIKHN